MWTFNLHKNFFEQLWQKKEKAFPSILSPQYQNESKRIKDNIEETTKHIIVLKWILLTNIWRLAPGIYKKWH